MAAKKSKPDKAKKEKGKKEEKSKDKKVIRDSFTIPENDYQLIKVLKQRCLDAGMSVKKSELLRAGLHALQEMSEKQLSAMIDRIEKVKTGRPAKSDAANETSEENAS